LQQFLSSVESALLPLATPYTPEGSKPLAVVHQWLFALAYEQPLFASQNGITADALIRVLTDLTLFKTTATFKKKLLATTVIKPPSTSKFTFIDLFAGIGGMRIGFQNAGGTCVFSSEFEKNAQETYSVNHGDFSCGHSVKITPISIAA
jgi:DNA (cytosine-5)-methyltransferase 1